MQFYENAELKNKIRVLELNFNEPTAKVLNLKLSYSINENENNITDEFWRTGPQVFFLYKLHLLSYPKSLRPSFPTGLLDFCFPSREINELEYLEKLKDRIGYFFETFIEICGSELLELKEFQAFVDSSVITVEFPVELDVTENLVLPVKEWLPATSHFIRSSISRIRRRSPSPHLNLDHFEQIIFEFEDEKRLARQRMRLADLEPKRLDLIPFSVDNDLEINSYFFKETKEFEQRKDLLERSLKSISYLMNTLNGCKSLLKEINLILTIDDDDDEVISEELMEMSCKIIDKFDSDYEIIEDHLKYPLNVQLEDVYSLTRGINERIFSFKSLNDSLTDQQLSFDELSQIQCAAMNAMQRAQGSLSNLTSSSLNYDRKISAKNAEIERKIRKVEDCSEEFARIDENVSGQLETWEIISDTFLADKLKVINKFIN